MLLFYIPKSSLLCWLPKAQRLSKNNISNFVPSSQFGLAVSYVLVGSM